MRGRHPPAQLGRGLGNYLCLFLVFCTIFPKKGARPPVMPPAEFSLPLPTGRDLRRQTWHIIGFHSSSNPGIEPSDTQTGIWWCGRYVISAIPAILVPQSSAFDISKIKGVFFSRISRRMVFGPEKAKSLLILLAGSRKQIFVAKQRGLTLFWCAYGLGEVC